MNWKLWSSWRNLATTLENGWSAQDVVKTTQVITQIKERLQDGCTMHKASGRHIKSKQTTDILEMAEVIMKSGIVENPGQSLEGFDNFQEPFSSDWERGKFLIIWIFF